ncbi:Demethylmenaquinone methyltransferase [compost metagenome]
MFGVRQLYVLYFRYMMPMLGKMFARSYKEYSWLQESASTFPGMRELARMFEQAGLEQVQVKPFTFGVAAMHVGYKPKKF